MTSWIPPYITRRINRAHVPDGWLAATANAYEVEARARLAEAAALVLDRPYRHKRKAALQAKANHAAMHARALRELLTWRQEMDRAEAGREALKAKD